MAHLKIVRKYLAFVAKNMQTCDIWGFGILRGIAWLIVTDVSGYLSVPPLKMGPIGCPETSTRQGRSVKSPNSADLITSGRKCEVTQDVTQQPNLNAVCCGQTAFRVLNRTPTVWDKPGSPSEHDIWLVRSLPAFMALRHDLPFWEKIHSWSLSRASSSHSITSHPISLVSPIIKK